MLLSRLAVTPSGETLGSNASHQETAERWVHTRQVTAASPYCGDHERAIELGVRSGQQKLRVRRMGMAAIQQRT